MLAVSEIFESVQGEGPNIGRPSIFIRLAGCNLHCVWCDAAYTWRFSDKHDHVNPQVYDAKSEIKKMSRQEVIDAIHAYQSSHIVITGGEPLLQRDEVTQLILSLKQKSKTYSFEFETAGTLRPLSGVHSGVTYVVSPKLSNSGNTLEERYNPTILREFRSVWASFKFVVANDQDLLEVDELVKDCGILPKQVYIMPEGTDVETISRRSGELVGPVIARRYNLTTRLQIFTFGNKRGT